MSMGRCVYSF